MHTMIREHDTSILLFGIGNRVRKLRVEKKISVRELARLSELSPRFINQLEAGDANIAIAGLARLAAALDRTISELIPPAEYDGSAHAGIQRWLYESNDNDIRDLQQWIDSRKQAGSATSAPRFIALIGLRGVGKSTVGPMLGKRLKREFVELDQWVEDAAGMKLGEIFSTHGEAYYRRLERQALDRLFSTSGGCIFAPGGSIVTDEESWSLIKRRCVTVWLHATVEEFMKRMRKQGDMRPMQGRPAANAELKALLSRREPLYAESQFTVKTTGRSPSAVTSEIAKAVVR
ncbi:MAG: family transcriptional regulator, aerobic/anaerobic benzoate catabolism transcriptional [Blastocatellia bacterium]|jgi:XRE family aerobic/anaerobic benzoate catabolism transcriptional regulator|nr:family transcriptional regulator, aerobic/anaerobic benzoate catabolism transcriptional [Blastocatellia bacterium]